MKVVKFFGSIFLISISIFGSPKVSLTKKEVLKGEPLNLEIEYREEGEIEFKQNSFSASGVVAEFIGQEDSISNINGRVTRKKVFRFRILTNKTGTLNTPSITFEQDGNTETIAPIPFNVKNEKYKPKQESFTGDPFFDKFFSGNGMGNFTENFHTAPTSDDFQIHFFPMKSNLFVGESIISSFKIYYKNLPSPPSVQRNMVKGIEFPFFTFELLGNMEIKISPIEYLDGVEYNTIPYNQEIYIITPLRKGKFQLGESDFVIQGGLGTYFQPIEKKSRKKTIIVRELPPAPENFSGQIGEYKASVNFTKTNSKEGEAIPFELKISGYGGLGNWKDPLKKLCEQNLCAGKIIYISESKTKQIAKLDYGGYGYQTENTFKYSFIPEKEGEIKLPNLILNYFNPSSENYKNISLEFPNLKIEKGNPFSMEKVPSGFILFWKSWAIYFLGLGFFGFAIYLAKEELYGRAKVYLDKLQIFRAKTPEEILKFDSFIGNKKGTLLRVFLTNKGLAKAKIEEIILLKAKTENLETLYENSKIEEKKYLNQLIKDVVKEIKL